MNRQAVSVDKKMKWTDYKPDDCTPLFDAMGRSLNDLKNHVSDEDVVLVTIITDGYENASREYSGRDIKNLVAELKKRGWVFAYIGTNQDVDAVADDMGIRSRMSYEYSDRGACDMFEAERSSKRAFFNRLSRYGRSIVEEDLDYFSLKDDEEEPEKESDITWDVKEENKPSSDIDNQGDNKNDTEGNDQQLDTPTSDTGTDEPEKPEGFWGKMKNLLK